MTSPVHPQERTRIVVVGGVAAGMSAAARARRLDERAEVVVLEQSEHVSFASCGLPYHLSGEIDRRDDLLLHTPDSLRAALDLDVRTGSRAVAVDPDARVVTVRTSGGEYELSYDALLLAPGAVPVRPPIPGIDHPAVHSLRTIPDLDRVIESLERLPAARATAALTASTWDRGRAVVIGAGPVGLEAVEALVARGLSVELVEIADQVLPLLDADLAPLLSRELSDNGVGIHLGVSAQRIAPRPDGSVTLSLSDGTELTADLVLVSVGVRPASELAREAGLRLGPTGAITVDLDQRTSDPSIWAAGDAVEVRRATTGAIGSVPLAGPANRQGRRAADSMLGRRTTPQADVLGTSIVRVFGLTAAFTGANRTALGRARIPYEVVRIHPGHHAGYFPGSQQLHIVATFAPDGRLLGAHAVGRAGVDKRIDVLATALRAGMGADDLAELELAYAPPYGSAKDPVNMLGFVAQNVLDGTMPQWHPEELDDARRNTLVLDVRTRDEAQRDELPGALNIPHTELRRRLDEVHAAAGGRPVSVVCASGVRSYIATRALISDGLDARNLSGGLLSAAVARSELVHADVTGAVL